MSSAVDLHVLYRIANTPILEYPFPHILVRDVFPADFYRELRANLPEQGHLRTLGQIGRIQGGDYPARLVMPLTRESIAPLPPAKRAFWESVGNWILAGPFGSAMLTKFAPYVTQRLGDLGQHQFGDEVLIVRDGTSYTLGPHTDNRKKVLSFLFYLPPDDSHAHLGTSIYLPNDPKFRCEGGPHHDFSKFRRVLTMPYLPNTLFAFMKTSNSFHGVEPIREPGVRRDLMLYDIRMTPAALKVEARGAARGTPAAKFSF